VAGDDEQRPVIWDPTASEPLAPDAPWLPEKIAADPAIDVDAEPYGYEPPTLGCFYALQADERGVSIVRTDDELVAGPFPTEAEALKRLRELLGAAA
jgi:hypothetical protein